MKPVSWLTSAEAAAHLGMTFSAFRKLLQRERAEAKARGRRCRIEIAWLRGRQRFRAANLDALIETEH